MSWVAILTAAASILIGHHVPVSCNHPLNHPWVNRIDGYAEKYPDEHIWLKYCKQTIMLKKYYVTVFAHEIIHIEHKSWTHPRVYKMESVYQPIVNREILKLRYGIDTTNFNHRQN